ncbi:MAG TPA: hypothetical protein VLJ37_00155 [bacterium]|nr:hypothetical protein [bacterium]
MKRWILLGLFAAVFVALVPAEARAFTLIEICANPAAPQPYKDCCTKCGMSASPTDFKCCLDSGGTTCSCVPPKNGCTADADCPDDMDPCTKPVCKVVGGVGVCGFDKNPNCVPCVPPAPPPSECSKDADCEKDGDRCTAPKCTVTMVDGKCPEGTVTADGATGWGWPIGKCQPETPIANCRPGECPRCPDCPPIPKIDCDVVGDPKMKSCCEEKGGLLWFVLTGCIDKGPGSEEGCTNWAKYVENSGVFQQCCLINYGVIKGDINMCNNVTGGGPTPTGGTPTTPSGSASALTCSVAQVGEPVEGKFEVSYTVPASAGPVVSATLTQVSGSQIRVEGEAEPADFGATVTAPKSMSTKAISDANNPPTFTVFAPTPKSMIGEWKAPFEVQVSLNTLEGGAGTAVCTESHFLHAEGQGCGCDMTSQLTSREQIVAYLVMAALLSLPLWMIRVVRAKAKKTRSVS